MVPWETLCTTDQVCSGTAPNPSNKNLKRVEKIRKRQKDPRVPGRDPRGRCFGLFFQLVCLPQRARADQTHPRRKSRPDDTFYKKSKNVNCLKQKVGPLSNTVNLLSKKVHSTQLLLASKSRRVGPRRKIHHL